MPIQCFSEVKFKIVPSLRLASANEPCIPKVSSIVPPISRVPVTPAGSSTTISSPPCPRMSSGGSLGSCHCEYDRNADGSKQHAALGSCLLCSSQSQQSLSAAACPLCTASEPDVGCESGKEMLVFQMVALECWANT